MQDSRANYGCTRQLLHMHTHKGNLVVERVKHAVELYDLEADPGERQNLCYRYPDVFAELKALSASDW